MPEISGAFETVQKLMDMQDIAVLQIIIGVVGLYFIWIFAKEFAKEETSRAVLIKCGFGALFCICVFSLITIIPHVFTGPKQGITVTANEDLAFRTGPNTKYVGLPKYDKSIGITAYERENGNAIAWVLLEYEYGGKIWRGYTGLWRISTDADIPYADFDYKEAYLKPDSVIYAAPNKKAGVRKTIEDAIQVVFLEYDGKYAYIEFYDDDSNRDSRGYVKRTCLGFP